MNNRKIIIAEYAQSVADPNVLVAYTANGGRLDLHRCDVPDKRVTKGQLYVTGSGLFFSLTKRGGLRQINVQFSPAMRIPGRKCHNGQRGNLYPKVMSYGEIACHILVCTAFHGPRPTINGIRYQCDHKNGDIMDWSKDNLEWVTPAENAKRAKLLRVLRNSGRDPRKMSYAELDAIFAKYEFVNPKNID